ncbi:MAG: hypothetical protein ACREO8_05885 [Luteimonas sp.]
MTTRFFRSLRTRLSGIDLSRLFAPRKPRHPLLRVLFGLIGLTLLAALLVIGVFIGAAMLIGGLLLRSVRRSRRPTPLRANAVDGEYRVVRKTSAPGQPLLR